MSTELQASFPLKLGLAEKTYGVVHGTRRKYVRNYGRVLKNGRGMTYLHAYYEANSSEFLPLYWRPER